RSPRDLHSFPTRRSSDLLVVASANPSLTGDSVMFTATVISALWSPAPGGTVAVNPTGVVTFFDGTTVIGQATLNSADGTTSVIIDRKSTRLNSSHLVISY